MTMPEKIDGMDDAYVIGQPLTTEDGFINEACMNELAAAIRNMPPDYERLSGDPEWSVPRIVHWRDILGYFAAWSVRQISHPDATPSPPGLESMLGYLAACLRPHFDQEGFAELSLCDINKLLHGILMEEDIFLSWNDEATLKGWIDLDALLRNVCLSIRAERRANDAFDEKFASKMDAKQS